MKKMRSRIIKLIDLIPLPGPQRFIAEVETGDGVEDEILSEIINGESIKHHMRKFLLESFNLEYSADIIRTRGILTDTYTVEELNGEVAHYLYEFQSKLEDKIIKKSKIVTKTGYIYETNNIERYYLRGAKYSNICGRYKEIFQFLPNAECIDNTKAIAYVHEYLMKVPQGIPIFLYTLSSFISKDINSFSKINDTFSLWVHSTDYKYARGIVNIFSNLFTYNPQSIFNDHRFHINTASRTPYRIEDYIDTFTNIPLLIYSVNSNLNISSKHVKDIVNLKAKNYASFSPVFIAASSTRSPNVLTIDVNNIELPKRGNFNNLKIAVNCIYLRFIIGIESILDVVNKVMPADFFHFDFLTHSKSKEFSLKYSKYVEREYGLNNLADRYYSLKSRSSSANDNNIIRRIDKLLADIQSKTEIWLISEHSELHNESINPKNITESLLDIQNSLLHINESVIKFSRIYTLYRALDLYGQMLRYDNMADDRFIDFAADVLESVFFNKSPFDLTKVQTESDIDKFLSELQTYIDLHGNDSPQISVWKN